MTQPVALCGTPLTIACQEVHKMIADTLLGVAEQILNGAIQRAIVLKKVASSSKIKPEGSPHASAQSSAQRCDPRHVSRASASPAAMQAISTCCALCVLDTVPSMARGLFGKPWAGPRVHSR
eukprot:gnl/TRDRNA2_/TRDRNA2_142367_c0_seq1.p1 gnl/TRDRNA2_/TRDRNA2_142367_c0~~gnl/TRDRNA2_/TRDRNA2_142367_c0_seq1.p1  ORF type:complete len:122 (+),score=1.04 gnl/TRDRNA2_/TRDRNA2_142367_c0_seq1:150-515(+)